MGDDKSFILMKTKFIKVVVPEEEETKSSISIIKDEDGFEEFVSKQEKRRRHRSSCSEDTDDFIKDIVPFVPRPEIPEVQVEDNTKEVTDDTNKNKDKINELTKKTTIKEVSESDDEISETLQPIAPLSKKEKKEKHRKDSQTHRRRTLSKDEKEVEEIAQKIEEDLQKERQMKKQRDRSKTPKPSTEEGDKTKIEDETKLTDNIPVQIQNKNDQHKLPIKVESKEDILVDVSQTILEKQVTTSDIKEKTEPEKVVEDEENKISIEVKSKEYNLPIPDHANDWMDIMDEGGFTLDSDDENDDLNKTIINDEQVKANDSDLYKSDNNITISKDII